MHLTAWSINIAASVYRNETILQVNKVRLWTPFVQSFLKLLLCWKHIIKVYIVLMSAVRYPV